MSWFENIAYNVSFMHIVFYILLFIHFIITERLFFIITAFICGYACKHDCDKCKCWSCTHNSEDDYEDFIMRDYSEYCGKKFMR